MCYVQGCQEPVYLNWQRWATEEEIERYKESGDLPETETSARITVEGCEQHVVANPHETHDADCAAPANPCCSAAEE